MILNLLFLIFLYIFLGIIIERIKYKKNRLLLLFILGFSLRLIIAVIIYINSNNVFGTIHLKDEVMYLKEAKYFYIKGLIPFKFLLSRNYNYVFFNWFHFYIFQDVNVLYPVITNIFISSITYIYFYDTIKKILGKYKKNIYYLLFLLMFMPDAMLLSATNRKDTILIFLILLYCKLILKLIKKSEVKILLKLFIVIVIIFGIRFYFSFLFLFIVFVVLFTRNIKVKSFGKIAIKKLSIKKKLAILMLFLILILGIYQIQSIKSQINRVMDKGILNIINFHFKKAINKNQDFYIKSFLKQSNGISFKVVIITLASFIVTPNVFEFFTAPWNIKLPIISTIILFMFLPFLVKSILNFHKKKFKNKIILIIMGSMLFFHSLTPYLADWRHRSVIMPLILIVSYKESLDFKFLERNIIKLLSLILIIFIIGFFFV